MSTPPLSIVVPTRNEEANILRFLGSVPPGPELVIVDSSDDSTPKLVAGFARQPLRLLRGGSNVTQARQIGAEAASAELLLFTDADVVFAPDYFDRLPARLDGALYGPKLSRSGHERFYRGFAFAQALCHRLGIPAVSGSNLLVSRHALEAVGGFDLELNCNEDSELGWRLARAGFQVAWDPDLRVEAIDHRRLDRGRAAKVAHSVLRCALLYAGLVPRKLRRHDWGYWTSG